LSSNLCADFYSDSLSCYRFVVVSAFPSLPFLLLSVNSLVFTLLPSHSSSQIVVATRQVSTRRTAKEQLPRNRYCANLERATDQALTLTQAKWLASDTTNRVLGSCNGIVLCGIPYRRTGATRLACLYEPASFPFRVSYLMSQAAPEAPLLLKQLSEIITQLSELQALILCF
jgi:hypothetical protein